MALQLEQERNPQDASNARIGYKSVLLGSISGDYSAVLIPNTWERFESASGTIVMRLQCSANSVVDYVGMAAHNLFTAGSTLIKIEVATSVGGGYSTVYSETPKSNSPIMANFDPQAGIDEIRITITGGTDREIGVVYAGEALTMERGIFGGHSPINLSGQTEYRNAMSDSGQFLGRRIKRKGLQGNFTWSNLTDDFYRISFQPFVIAAKTTPFFIQWRPDFYIDEVAFGYTTSDITPTNQGGGIRLMGVGFSMRAHDE